MAKYTITIKELIDNNFAFALDEYPIFDENYREVLNKKILDNYLIYEIGFETPALFNHYLASTLNNIMPYYNNLYKSIQGIKDFTSNVNLKEDMKRTAKNSSESTSTSNTKSKNVYQDTPEGELVHETIDNFSYATNMNNSGTTGSDNTVMTGNTTDDYIKLVTGNNGVKYPAEVIKDIKNNLVNVDMLIINELSSLFMGLM